MTEETQTPPAEKPAQQPNSNYTLVFLAETIRTIVVVVILAYILRLFVLQPFVVEGSSMHPRFETNDYLIVDKVSYEIGTPQRGDIIVFRYPNDPSTSYVKRIIGLPGERVVIENGHVKIINASHPNGFVLDESGYLASDVLTTVPTDTTASFDVTAGHYFVLGDNRPASSDSREWGLLPRENIIGRVFFQAYPLDHTSLIHHARYS